MLTICPLCFNMSLVENDITLKFILLGRIKLIMNIKKFSLSRISPQMKNVLSLVTMQGLFWWAWATGSYGTVYLQDIGFSASEIGTINAICSLVAIFAIAIWGMVSDKINSVKKTFIIALIGNMIFYTAVPFVPQSIPFLFFLYYPVFNIFRCTLMPLLDNLTVRSTTKSGANYGIIRGIGSFIYSMGSFLIVALIPIIGISNTFIMAGILNVPLVILLFFADDPKIPTRPKKGKKSGGYGELFKNYYYVCFLIFAAIAFIGFSGEFSFISYFLEARNISKDNMGTFLAVRAFAEIPMLFLMAKIRKKIKLKYLIIIGICFMATECICFAFFVHDLFSACAFGALFGFGNGMFIGSVAMYIYKLAPDHLKATAQALYSSVASISGIIGNLLGGYLFDTLGVTIFYLCVGGIIFLAISIFAITTLSRKNLPNPADELG